MKKQYIVIKNCPNYYYEKEWEHPYRCNLTDGDWSCDVACTPDDVYGFKCPIKQAAELCRLNDGELAKNILKLFDAEDVEVEIEEEW